MRIDSLNPAKLHRVMQYNRRRATWDNENLPLVPSVTIMEHTTSLQKSQTNVRGTNCLKLSWNMSGITVPKKQNVLTGSLFK